MFYRRISWSEASHLWQSSTPIYIVNELMHPYSAMAETYLLNFERGETFYDVLERFTQKMDCYMNIWAQEGFSRHDYDKYKFDNKILMHGFVVDKEGKKHEIAGKWINEREAQKELKMFGFKPI